ncbi:MAG: DUF2293 domain-containing protein [Deltaproteobacteria bacterium]|nr:DUF2293 domain-containing protein [Deltaproteobacteria bacterium]
MSGAGAAASRTLTVAPGPRARTVRTDAGEVLAVPEGWEHLPPGDAGLTRRVKAAGPTWTMKEKVGRRDFSRGLWAPAAHIASAQRALERERATPEYERKLAQGRERRAKEQVAYEGDFRRAVVAFLRFAPRHAAMASELAERVAAHATVVGSGTVGRTQRISIAERAEAAVIAWMRHATTAYDHMQIARVKGRRREVRRELAKGSRALLERYRRGEAPDAACPLAKALATPRPAETATSEAPPTPAPAPRARAPRAAAAVSSPPTPTPAPRAQAPRAAAAVSSPSAPRPTPPARRPPPPAAPPGDEPAAREARQAAVRARLARRTTR